MRGERITLMKANQHPKSLHFSSKKVKQSMSKRTKRTRRKHNLRRETHQREETHNSTMNSNTLKVRENHILDYQIPLGEISHLRKKNKELLRRK